MAIASAGVAPTASPAIGDKTVLANLFPGSTNEERIQAAIDFAFANGATMVYIPANMFPYDPSLITFNARPVREGGDPAHYDAKAFGARGDFATDDRTAIFKADSAAAPNDQLVFPSGTYIIGSNLTQTAPWHFDAGAVLRPINGAVITLANLVTTEGTQHFDTGYGGSVNTSAFRRWKGRYGNFMDVFALGETGNFGGTRISSEVDLVYGDSTVLGERLHKHQWALQKRIKFTDTGTLYTVTAVGNVANRFSVAAAPWTINQFGLGNDTCYVVRFTSGNQVGHQRWITSNTVNEITCGMDFFTATYGNIQVGDQFRIWLVEMQAPEQSPLQLYIRTDEDGNPQEPTLMIGEDTTDVGASQSFGRIFSGVLGVRPWIKFVPSGTSGTYDIQLGFPSSFWRHMLFVTNDSGGATVPWLAGYYDSGSNLVDVVLGRQAALATNATHGFTYIPTSAGAPTGVPASYTGKVAMQYDTTNNKLWVYNGGWKFVVLA